MDIMDTLKMGERVTSKYAENYFDDDDESSASENNDITLKPSSIARETSEESNSTQNGFRENWVSPSDLLIGIIELTPPFTSKITRGVTHEGIISIGNGMLAKERQKFERELRQLLRDNDAAWNHILMHEKQQVKQKVRNIFMKIFEGKRKIMTTEMSQFYKNSLQELEDHLRSEIQQVLLSAHSNIISDLNIEISKKLKEERGVLEKVLEKKFRSDIKKINTYYKQMSDYELNRHEILIKKALQEKNDALSVFYKQVEAETMTSTMYVMSMERKKCKIKQFFLENYQSSEIKQKLEKIKEKQEIIDLYKQTERFIPDINLEWKERIKKVIQLFLKFISFSLKLLPEQTTFLLDLEKMFVLQLNEIQKQPESAPNILIDVEESLNNIFQFEENEPAKDTCDKEPFEVVGDTSDSIPTPYGSRETLPSHVDLPAITVVREKKFIYAKCCKFDEVKNLVESQTCKCIGKEPSEISSHIPVTESVSKSVDPDQGNESFKSESSIELMQVDDIKRMQECPFRYCQDWRKKYSFDISKFVDYTEDNFKIVENRFNLPLHQVETPEIISAKEMAHRPLPFVRSAKPYHDAVTQCSSDEDASLSKTYAAECTCVKKVNARPLKDCNDNESKTKLINEIIMKRRISMQRLLFSNPNLLKMFTDESFDLTY